MRKKHLCTILGIVWFAFASYTGSFAETGIIVNPDAVDYPLIRSTPYPSRKGDPYEADFGIRRWLNPVQTRDDPDFKLTLQESYNWHKVFGGYGVIGHGEDVFTSKGAEFRRTHRGR